MQVREGALTGTNTINHNIFPKTTGTATFDDGIAWPDLRPMAIHRGVGCTKSGSRSCLDAEYHLNAGSPGG
ncbi:MAG: hypothetical protein IPP17_30610 [Bacteroidetes bacterium]|nr:hypothetical protein [Bacteroidota bacterium]